MNVTMMRLRPVVKELRDIRYVLDRIAACMEADMAQREINVRVEPTTLEPTIGYTDEEMGYLEEKVEFFRREQQRADEADGD